MRDHVPSPYGPRDFDCTGDPACWPCGTGLEEQPAAPPALESSRAAAKRLGVSPRYLRLAALEYGLPSARVQRLTLGLPPASWDAAHAQRMATVVAANKGRGKAA